MGLWLPEAPDVRGPRRPAWPWPRRRTDPPPDSADVVTARVRRRIAEDLATADAAAPVPLAGVVREALHREGEESGHAVHALEARAVRLEEDLVGFGPLTPWIRAPGITDVLVDAAGAVWTDGEAGLVRRPLTLPSEVAEALAVRLVTQAGRRLDAAVPLADARVHGIRVHAVLPPVSGAGPVLSLRIPAARTPAVAELAQHWPDGERWHEVIAWLVRARATVLVSGATGSGKTTLLSAALSLVPAHERIITVEDTREAAPEHPHVVPLQCRAPNAEGAGEVGLAALIREALRMRPDRLVVGECRGAEVTDFLTALNTGHQGAWGTLHANAAQDVPARLVAMGALAGWPPGAVHAQVRAGVDAVLHVGRDVHGRHPGQLGVPDRPADPSAPLTVLPALTWRAGTGTQEGPGWTLLRERLAGREPPGAAGSADLPTGDAGLPAAEGEGP